MEEDKVARLSLPWAMMIHFSDTATTDATVV